MTLASAVLRDHQVRLYRSETPGLLGAVLCSPAGRPSGMAAGMFLPFGYLILSQVLRLAGKCLRGDRSKNIGILLVRHQVAVLRRQVARVDLQPTDGAELSALSQLRPRSRWSTFFVTLPRCCGATGLVAWEWPYP
ncbi:hypothetical protein Q2K19_22690 [Micromonospora soli]|uniref:hypothetical protein n=1 Tax=Micromonospora sp. NBRC 110009 TaxID=3061627 RepID=UPI0026724E19|nr:hypothetical protein [Micromonospora sp. NBRC 110009]WKT96974.1 hypothetical protein Q2K19_22690 [Micromonospora sp. NBRC 110009]